MVIALTFLVVVLIALLVVSVVFNIKHARVILNMEDAVGEALDVCDQAYMQMSDVMNIPVALNTPEVRQVMNQIQSVRSSVLYVSNVLAAPVGGVAEEVDRTDES